MASQDARAYLASHEVEQKLSDAVAAVLKTRPADPLTEIAKNLGLGAAPNYLATVGNTPLVRLDKVLPPEAKHAKVYGKMEMQNPGGSVKDRIAMNMIETLEKEGKIKPGDTLVDISSGNTAIGECLVAAAKGYKMVILMPQVGPMYERYLICRAFGAQVILGNAAFWPKGFQDYVDELCKKPGYFYLDQFNNMSNPEAHIKTTGPEIWAQTKGQVDYFIHGIGTGGCVHGTGTFLKSKKPSCTIVALEPEESRVHVGNPPGKHSIVGIGAGFHSNFLEKGADDKPRGIIDEWGSQDSAAAIKWAKALATEEGMMVGPSAGAAMAHAVEIAKRPTSAGKTIVVLFASHAIRYTGAHPLWADLKAEATKGLIGCPAPSKENPFLMFDSTNIPA